MFLVDPRVHPKNMHSVGSFLNTMVYSFGVSREVVPVGLAWPGMATSLSPSSCCPPMPAKPRC